MHVTTPRRALTCGVSQSMQRDVRLASEALPDSASQVKLQFQSAEMRRLLEDGAADISSLRAEEDGPAPAGEWLLPPAPADLLMRQE